MGCGVPDLLRARHEPTQVTFSALSEPHLQHLVFSSRQQDVKATAMPRDPPAIFVRLI